MRILFLSAWFPAPPSNGSRLRVHHLLRALAPHHDVTLLSFADEPDVDRHVAALRPICREVVVVPHRAFEWSGWRGWLGALSRRPRSLVATYSAAAAEAIARTVAASRCEGVVASQLACAAYASAFDGRPALFEEVEVGALHARRAGAAGITGWRARLMWLKHCRYLRALLRHFRACTVVSERERALLGAAIGNAPPVHVVPNGVMVDAYPPGCPRPDTLIFTGSFRYRPNYEAMRWFVGSVWPRVVAVRPAARLLITGAHDQLPLPASTNVERVGFVDDIRPLMAGAWLAIAPLLSGGGTRIKILEAMAAGTPVVATRKGVEGLDAVPGESVLLADQPQEFAEHVLALLTDARLRARLARGGRAFVAEHHDWRMLGPRFEALVREVFR